MNRPVSSRYGLISYLLIVSMIGVVALYVQNRSVDTTAHNRRLELLLRLRQMDTQLDRDVLRVASLQISQYDPLVVLAAETRALGRQLSEPAGGFVGATTPEVESAIRLSVATLNRKLEQMERIKSDAALLRNAVQYLPQAVDEYSARDPRMGARLSRMLNRSYVANLLPSETDIAWIRRELRRAQADGPTQDPLFHSILFHMQAHLENVANLGTLRAAYAGEPAARQIAALQRAYDEHYLARTRRSDLLSLGMLGATILLVGSLAFTLRRLDHARVEAVEARLKLHDAVASLSEAFSLFDARGRLVLHNDRFLAFYPWLAGHIAAGKTMDELRALNEPHLLPAGESPVDAGGTTYLQHTTDGKWYLASENPTSDGGLVCVRVDVTESKQRELELRKLSRALEQSPVSVIITDTQGTIEYVNPKFEEATGYTAAEAIGNNPRLLKSGEKRPHEYRQMWETITAGREWRGVFLNRRKDGELFWESASISPLRDDQGRITHFVAVKEDISQRKLAEETLRLHAKVFETTTEGIIITDASNQIRTVNPAFTRITGYTAAEVVGRDPRVLSSGRHDPEFYRDMWRELVAGGQWSGEIWNRRKNGEVYPEWLSIISIPDERGRIREFIAVFSDITQRKRDEEQILRQANYDALTGLPNRTLLFDRLSQAMALAARAKTQVALLFIDLDRFKGINDGLGHVVGDEVLRVVAERLRGAVRQSDTVARFGGDEFVIVLEHVTSLDAVGALAEKVILTVAEPYHLGGRELFIGASIGISLFPDDATEADALMRNADVAMYQAKEGGRNRFQFFTAEMNRRTEARLELERGLRRALERGQFRLEYQPIYNLRTGEIVKVEALLRWQHPELGLIRPERFVRLAEESGLIAPIGMWTLRTACAQVERWRRQPGLAHLRLAVNLSSRQWRLGLDADAIRQVLVDAGLEPAMLTLEITEGMVLEETEEAIAWLHEIRALGVELAVDDFGTGYSSLSYLKRFPVAELKIDYSFVRDLPGDAGSVSLVHAIISLARSLNLSVVAEGVETPEQLAFLHAAGCDFVQGFLLSAAQPPEKIPMLARQEMAAHVSGRMADLFS